MPELGQTVPPITDRLSTAHDVPTYLVMPVATLNQWRYLGIGPAAYRLGRHIRDEPATVQTWLNERAS